MLEEMTWEQFQEWVTFSSLSPFTADREEYRFAAITQMIANMNRDTKKRRDPYSIDMFVLRFGDMPEGPKKKQAPEEQMRIARQYFLMFGGK